MPSKVRGLFSTLFCLGRRRRCRLGTAKPKVSRTQGFASARALGSGGSRTCGTCMSRPFWCAHPCSSHPVDQRAAASSWACAGGPRTNNRRPTPTRCRSCCTFPIRSEVQRQARAPRPRSRPRHCCWWGMHLATRLRDACRRGTGVSALPHGYIFRLRPAAAPPIVFSGQCACEPSLEPVRMMLY